MSIDNQVKEAVLVVARAQVAEALGGDVLGKIVADVLNHRPTYSYNNQSKTTVLEDIIREQIGVVAREAVREALGAPELREQIRVAVVAKAEAFAVSVADAFTKEDWRAELNIKLEGDR